MKAILMAVLMLVGIIAGGVVYQRTELFAVEPPLPTEQAVPAVQPAGAAEQAAAAELRGLLAQLRERERLRAAKEEPVAVSGRLVAGMEITPQLVCADHTTWNLEFNGG